MKRTSAPRTGGVPMIRASRSRATRGPPATIPPRSSARSVVVVVVVALLRSRRDRVEADAAVTRAED